MNNKEKILHAKYDGRINLGNFNVSCYVLNNFDHVILRKDFFDMFGSKIGKPISLLEAKEPLYYAKNKTSPKGELLYSRLREPISFIDNRNIKTYGYDATIVTEYCRLVLKARQYGYIDKNNLIALVCEDIIISLANVGITALIDEATGFQYFREKDALQRLLDSYLSKYLKPWEKRFQHDFYVQLFRLKKWDLKKIIDLKKNKPLVVGKITKDIVYSRMLPGLIEELEKKNPKVDGTRRAAKHHQFLETPGQLALRDHLVAITALMKSADTWYSFYARLQKVYPKKNEQLCLDFYEEELDK